MSFLLTNFVMMLFLLILLAHHSSPKNRECYHGQLYRDDIEPPQWFLELLTSWKVPLPGISAIREECEASYGKCQTFRCEDTTGIVHFVINACNDGDYNCKYYKELQGYCEGLIKNGQAITNLCPKCKDEDGCNWDKLTLEKPIEAGNKACVFSFVVRPEVEKTLLSGLKNVHMRGTWNITNFTPAGAFKKECNFDVQCQTVRCKDEFGNDLWVANGCSTERDEKAKICSYDMFEHDCKKENGKYYVCDPCYGSYCNEHKTELEVLHTPRKPVKKTTRTTKTTARTTTTPKIYTEKEEMETKKGKTPKFALSTVRRTRKRRTTQKQAQETTSAASNTRTLLLLILSFMLPLFGVLLSQGLNN